MNTEETVGDLAAITTEIHDHVTEQADRYDFDDGVTTRDALLALIDEAKTAVSLLETTMLKHLEEGAQQRGSRLFKRKRVTAERFRHDLIRAAIASSARLSAADTETGEISATRAVDFAVQAMTDLYVSPSTKAKIGALDNYGIERKAVHAVENKGWKLDVEELDALTDD